MSQMVDDDLLEGEDDDDGYDITREREEVLLQDEEDIPSKGGGHYENEKLYSDAEEDDVLNIHVEEDFQDDEKLLEDEDEPEERFRPKFIKSTNDATNKSRSMSPKNMQSTEQNVLSVKKLNSVHQRANRNQQNKKPPVRIDKWKRRNSRGANPSRSNFSKTNPPRRRNGTVLINPRYEGTVRVNENNARLAWDNSQYNQNNTNTNTSYVQPWNGNVLGSANLLVNNLMNGLASSLAQHTSSNVLMPQTTNQSFYEPPPSANYPPPTNNYDPPLAFEPPPHIVEETRYAEPYNVQAQPQTAWNNYADNSQMHNSTLLPSPPRTFPRDFPTQFNYPPPTRPQNTNNYLSNKYQTNSSLEVKKFPSKSFGNGNNYTRYNSNSSGFNYPQNDYQNRNYNNDYSVRKNTYNPSYENPIRANTNLEYTNYRTNQFNSYNSNAEINSPQRPQQFKNNKKINTVMSNQQNNESANKPNYVQKQSDNLKNNLTNRLGNRRQINEPKPTIPEKKMKTENKKSEENNSIEKKSCPTEQEEDEETRLYRLKIEEQKRERERILKIKEERRKQMIQHKEELEKKKLVAVAPLKPAQEQVKPNAIKQPIKSNDCNLKQIPQTVFVKQTSQLKNVDTEVTEVSNLKFKVSNTLPPVVSTVPKNESSSGFMSNRVVIVKNKNNPKSDTLRPVVNESKNDSADVGQGLSSFFNNRKVLKKDTALLNTRLVVVNNLSSNINHDKLMALSHGFGEIQQLRVDKQERQATILFKSVASAHAFFKKYQRRILDDLSVIEVKLEPVI